MLYTWIVTSKNLNRIVRCLDGRSGGVRSSHARVVASCTGGGGVLLRVGTGDGDTAVLSEGNVEAVVVPAAAEEDKGVAESCDENNIENTEEDHALGDTDDVTTVRDTPGNGVQEPEKVGPAREHHVVAVDTNAVGRAASTEHGLKGEEHVGEGSKGEEAPLVVGRNIGSNEIANDPDPGEEDVEDNGGPRDAGEDAESEDSSGERDNPKNILGPEDLAGRTMATDLVRLGDNIPGEVSRHSKVGDGSHEVGDNPDVVPEAFTAAGLELESKKDESVECKNGSCSPEPIRTVLT